MEKNMEKFKYQGYIVEGNVESTYISSKGRKYFVKLAGNIPEEIQCTSRGGYLWPVEGSLVLVEGKNHD